MPNEQVAENRHKGESGRTQRRIYLLWWFLCCRKVVDKNVLVYVKKIFYFLASRNEKYSWLQPLNLLLYFDITVTNNIALDLQDDLFFKKSFYCNNIENDIWFIWGHNKYLNVFKMPKNLTFIYIAENRIDRPV